MAKSFCQTNVKSSHVLQFFFSGRALNIRILLFPPPSSSTISATATASGTRTAGGPPPSPWSSWTRSARSSSPASSVTTPTTWRACRCSPWCCPTTRSTRASPASQASYPGSTSPSGRTPHTTPPPAEVKKRTKNILVCQKNIIFSITRFLLSQEAPSPAPEVKLLI